MKIQKRDLETGDTKPQGSATLKDTAFDIISLNDNSVLVEGKSYKKNEAVKTIRTDIEGALLLLLTFYLMEISVSLRVKLPTVT